MLKEACIDYFLIFVSNDTNIHLKLGGAQVGQGFFAFAPL